MADFYLKKDLRNRASVIEAIADHCADLPTDTEWHVVVQQRSEIRRTAQSKLWWRWLGEIGSRTGHSANYMHGELKLDVLLPLMLANEKTHERASFLKEVLEKVSTRKIQIAVAFDMIRSKDVSVAMFSELLSEVQRMYAERGIVLTSSDDIYYEAMGQQRRAA